MIWKQFTHLGNFPPELKARFNSFLTTEFDDSLSVEMQFRSIIKWCQENFKTVDILIDFINELSNWLKQFENNFDTKLEDRVISVLSEWQASGQLDVVISEALQWELDDFKSTTEQNFILVNQQLQETEKAVNDLFINVMNPPLPFQAPAGDGVTNDTLNIQSIINHIHSLRTDPKTRLRVFIPSGTYLMNQLKLPNNTNLYGAGRDNTVLKQVSGEVKDFIIDNEETGAYAIRVMDLRLDGDNNSSNGFNFGFNQQPSGYEFGMVWGVEGRMERVMVRNFIKSGFRVRSSVTSMEDVIAINCGVGYEFYGGSLVGNHLIGHDCNKFIEFRGSGHKLFGVHYETGTSKLEPLIDFYNNSTDNIIHDMTVQITASRTVEDLIRIQTPTFGNKIKDIKIQGIPIANIKTFVNDEQARDKVLNLVSSYEQNNRKPIVKVTDDNITNNSFRIYPEVANVLYSFEGTGGSVAFVMPRVSLAGLSVMIYNNADNRLRINAHELDSGLQVFGGKENAIYIEPRGSLKLISTGTQYNVQRYQSVYARNSGTVNIAQGVTTTTVTHGLGTTPTKIMVTPKGNVGSFWVADIGTGQFKVYCSVPPETTTEVSWVAEL